MQCMSPSCSYKELESRTFVVDRHCYAQYCIMALKATGAIAPPSPEEFWDRFVKPRIAQTLGISHRDKPDLIMQARQTIDAELAALHRAMCSLRERRNTLVPIFGLPPEVLARVFEFCLAAWPPTSWVDIGWIRVTHVCRIWRNAALHHPGLWSGITDRLGFHWVNDMTARSKAVPISYHQYGIDPMEKFSKVMIPHQLHRLRHLSISGFRDDSASVLQLLTSPAPIMEHLTLRGDSEIDRMYVLSPTAFEGHAPMLRRLTLSNVRIPWYSTILSGLTNLHVKLSDSTIYESPPDFDPSVDNADVTARYNQFFHALQAMPTLETLYLENCLPIKPASGADTHIVSLSHLSSLHLLSKSGQMRDILSRLDVPVFCRLSFHYDGRYRLLHGDSVDDFLPFLASHVRCTAEKSPLLTFSVNLENHQAVFKFWRTCQVSDNDIVVSRPQTSPDITIAFLHWMFCIEPVQPLCAALPVGSLRVLVVRGGGRTKDVSSRTWLNAFGPCQAVEHAVITGGGARGFCRALATPMDPEKARRKRDNGTSFLTLDELFLPSLRLLELERVDFHALVYPEEEDGANSDDESWQDGVELFGTLTDHLRTRSVGGGLRLTLALRKCSIDRRQVEALKKLARVTWDGITNDSHDQR